MIIPNSVTNIGTLAFAGCYGLTSVTFSSSINFISAGEFAGCSGLKDVSIPDFIESIGANAFNGCSGLTNVTIGKSVASIGDDAFFSCYGLTSVTIPESVTNIGSSAFAFCLILQSVFFQGNASGMDGVAGSADSTVFEYAGAGTAYYLPGSTGWGATFGSWPTAAWYQPGPQILGSGLGLGTGRNSFQFTISWDTNIAVVVEASTNLNSWTPVSTNTLVNGTNAFQDLTWTNYPHRFYRVRSK